MKIVTDERVALLVSRLVGKAFVAPFTAMGIERDGEVIGGVVFNVFEGTDLHVTVAGRGFNRSFLADLGAYVFQQLGCERMTVLTEQVRIVRIAEKLGGEIEGLLRNHFGRDRDAYLVGILKDDWKY
ncbi:GNAT family N-acetyltransferase [Rhizobium mesosinicum]|uniref:GNAT family N-acetyltransferase n=1 Tax=Rhizobium mesosinicum TaxID=335017 RepID=A0ABS7GU45_9HYPH|nr:GNAT family N-acetyltransferase [Rhizobium mesosinicum]